MHSDQSRIIEQAKFTYSPLREAFKKQVKTIEDKGRGQVEALKVLKPEKKQQVLESIEAIFPKEMRNNEIKIETDEVKKCKENIKRKDLKYETKTHIYGFQQYEQ